MGLKSLCWLSSIDGTESVNVAESLLRYVGRIATQVVKIGADDILIAIDSEETSAACPLCQGLSRKVHSRYHRRIRDLPWSGKSVVLQWSVRRFFCGQSGCPRQIFAERLPKLVGRHGRTSIKFNQALVNLGLECGGEGGRRLGHKQGIGTSGDTILRRLRAMLLEYQGEPRFIGIDDFAFRKGRRYGTVIVDHESGRVIDLLPERSVESTAAWLKERDLVEVVTRDRSSLYAAGISAGRPNAVQVADRFHLSLNLREAVVKLIKRHTSAVIQAGHGIAATAPVLPLPSLPPAAAETSPLRLACPPTPQPATACAAPIDPSVSCPQALSKASQLVAQRRQRKFQRYEQINELIAGGMNISQVAKQVGVNRCTIHRLLNIGVFVEQPSSHRASTSNGSIDPFAAGLKQMWDAGVHSGTELFRKIKAVGFTGTVNMVHRYIVPWREAGKATNRIVHISPNRLSWLLLKQDIVRAPDEQKLIEKLTLDCQPVREAAELAREFSPTMKEGKSEGLLGWIARVQASAITELKTFADGLMEDWKAVKAAVELPWSNGRVEGHVNRLKLIKRKMYGRAKFDLLRIRVMASGP
jgi:transposase